MARTTTKTRRSAVRTTARPVTRRPARAQSSREDEEALGERRVTAAKSNKRASRESVATPAPKARKVTAARSAPEQAAEEAEESNGRPVELVVLETALKARESGIKLLSRRELFADAADKRAASNAVAALEEAGTLTSVGSKFALTTQVELAKLPASKLAQMARCPAPRDGTSDADVLKWKSMTATKLLDRAEAVTGMAPADEPESGVGAARARSKWRRLQFSQQCGVSPRLVGSQVYFFDLAENLGRVAQRQRGTRRGAAHATAHSTVRPTSRSAAPQLAVSSPAISQGGALSNGNGIAKLAFGFEMGLKCFGLCVDEASGNVYVGSESGVVCELSATTGEVKRTLKLADGVRCIVSDKGHVFVGCNNGTLYDITQERPRDVAQVEGFSEVLGIGMDDGAVVAADASGNVALVNCEGEVVWQQKSADASAENGWLALVDSSGVYHGHSRGLAKYSIQGDRLWERPTCPVLLGSLNSDRSTLLAALSSDDCSDNEMAKRLKREGAQSGEVVVSLLWNNEDDLDLHVSLPCGAPISFCNRRSACNGMLDVDMNAGSHRSSEPVENIFWTETPPDGKYGIHVQQYNNRTNQETVPFEVQLKVHDTVQTFKLTWSQGQSKIPVHKFELKDGQLVQDGAAAPKAVKKISTSSGAPSDASGRADIPRNGVAVVDAASGALRSTLPIGSSVPSASASADGTRIFAAVKNGIACFDAATSERVWEVSTNTHIDQSHQRRCSPMSMVASADGTRLFALCGTRLLVIDVTDEAVAEATSTRAPHKLALAERDARGPLVQQLGGVEDLQRGLDDGSGITLCCVEEGSKLRVRAEPGQAVDCTLNCQFPRNLRVAGRRFKVQQLTKVSNFYRVVGDIVLL